jgi:hypothetical protein
MGFEKPSGGKESKIIITTHVKLVVELTNHVSTDILTSLSED